jgi:hypothetical protein
MDNFKRSRAVQELWDLYGPDAENAALERAQAAESRGKAELAKDWREIAEICKGLRDLPPREN